MKDLYRLYCNEKYVFERLRIGLMGNRFAINWVWI